MNSLAQAKTAYFASTAAIRSDRDNEYEALARVTRQMRAAAESADMPAVARAIHANRQLWTLLAADVADDDNGLPQELRARLFYLAEFSLLHGSKVLNGSAEIEPLIDINTAVMRGLQQQGGRP